MTRTRFQLLFASYRTFNLGRHFIVDKLPNLVLLRETIMRTLAVLLNTPKQIIRNSNVQDVVLEIREDVTQYWRSSFIAA